MFAVIAPDGPDLLAREMRAVFEAADGSIWCGGRNGVYRLQESGGTFTLSLVDFGFGAVQREDSFVYDVAADLTGSIWAAAASGLYRRWPDGRVARYRVRDGLPGGAPSDLMLDSKGRLWVASRDGGIFRISTTAGPEPPVVVEQFGVGEGLRSGWVTSILEASDGRLWAVSNVALVEIQITESPARIRNYDQTNGLSFPGMFTIGEDAGGNLWIGTEAAGAKRLARNGLITYSELDGLVLATALFEDPHGGLIVRGLLAVDAQGRSKPSNSGTEWKPAHLGQWLDGRFVARVPENLPIPWTGYKQTILAATNHEWWIGMGPGLAHFPATLHWQDLVHAKPRRIYSTEDGMSAPLILTSVAPWFPGCSKTRAAVSGLPASGMRITD
jgi:hypothetical protein